MPDLVIGLNRRSGRARSFSDTPDLASDFDSPEHPCLGPEDRSPVIGTVIAVIVLCVHHHRSSVDSMIKTLTSIGVMVPYVGLGPMSISTVLFVHPYTSCRSVAILDRY